ncbi:MAG: hypothetical protein ABJB69_09675, partial [Spartobacteria bacterium]
MPERIDDHRDNHYSGQRTQSDHTSIWLFLRGWVVEAQSRLAVTVVALLACRRADRSKSLGPYDLSTTSSAEP